MFQIGDQGATRKLEFCYTQSGNSNNWQCYVTTSNPVTTGSWQHMALTFTFGNAASIKVYYSVL
jgi:hypothetical protein